MDLERLGAALRERRETLGIPRAELARRVGVTPTYIWLLEGARPRRSGDPSRPAQVLLERWAKALGMDERYALQILRLAGYGQPEGGAEASDMRPPIARRASVRPAIQSLSAPAPIAMHAAAPPPAPQPRELQSFAEAPLSFPQPRDLESEVLLDRVREILDTAGRSDRDRAETVRLLESFLDWLRFRLEST